MILQALTRLFEDLVARGEISRPGWSPEKISYALCLEEDGSLTYVLPLLTEVEGKKALQPKEMKRLPAPVKRASNVAPNFLWDNSSYLLGVDEKGKPERSRACFRACAQLHHRLLDDVSSPVAKSILAFFDSWRPELAQDNPILVDCWPALMKGANLVFRVHETFAHEDPLICQAWDRYYADAQGEKTQCLVTGNLDLAEPVHPAVKGVVGAQSSGAALVSFNAPAFCSYGKEQNLNAPVGKYAAFAYTATLNHLLADRDNVHRIGDTTVVCWAEGAEPQYNEMANFSIFGDSAPQVISTDDLRATVKNLAQGLPSEELNLDPRRPFYILGLAPNAARLSVRFFYHSSFGDLMRNINAHYSRMEIVGNPFPITPLWALLRETVRKPAAGQKWPEPSPVMAGAMARAIFAGTAYPASVLEAVMLRIRAEREITPGRAAILKAYYLKNSSQQCPKEVLTVSLNENSTNIPYTLGRLFAVYEAVQESANPGINTTIKDKYFNSAAATPAVIFPILDNLCQKHLRKLDIGLQVFYDRQIGQLKDILEETYPTRFSLPEQGSFNLGYYHQKQFRYTKKEEQ